MNDEPYQDSADRAQEKIADALTVSAAALAADTALKTESPDVDAVRAAAQTILDVLAHGIQLGNGDAVASETHTQWAVIESMAAVIGAECYRSKSAAGRGMARGY